MYLAPFRVPNQAVTFLVSCSNTCTGVQLAYFGALSGWTCLSNWRLCLATSGWSALCPLLRSLSSACAKPSIFLSFRASFSSKPSICPIHPTPRAHRISDSAWQVHRLLHRRRSRGEATTFCGKVTDITTISKSADLSRKVPNPLNLYGIPVTLYVLSRHRD